MLGGSMSQLMNTYTRQEVAFVRGEGVWLYDETGKKYLDALAGVAVNTLGHAHPTLVRALNEQVQSIIHTSNLFRIPLQERAAKLVCDVTGLDEVFFCNSGCEANEAAIKLARLYGHRRGLHEPHVIVAENAFHGRTLATLSATGSGKAQQGFGPLVPGFVRVPLDDLDRVRAVAEEDANVAAVLIEPIQGEGGINVARRDYLLGLRALCDEKSWLFMCDEVQCGIGRTGKWFMYEHAGFVPDVVTLAKGLASGVPAGACVAGGRAKALFGPGSHGSTFGGNPLAMAAVIATLETIASEGLLENAARVGAAIVHGLRAELASVACVREIRGVGLMIGIELDRPGGKLVAAALERGLVLNVTHDRVVRLLPPLILSTAEARELVERLSALILDFAATETN